MQGTGGVGRDPTRARELYNEAHDAGSAAAAYFLGHRCHVGDEELGIEEDGARALQLFRRASEKVRVRYTDGVRSSPHSAGRRRDAILPHTFKSRSVFVCEPRGLSFSLSTRSALSVSLERLGRSSAGFRYGIFGCSDERGYS